MYTLCFVVAQQLTCAMSSCGVDKGLKVQWSKWRGGEPVGLFSVNDNAVLLLILCSCRGLTVLCSGGVLSPCWLRGNWR